MRVNLERICDCKVEGVDHKDYPDYCDAYISEAWVEIDSVLFCIMPRSIEKNGKYYRQLSDAELDWLNTENRDFVHETVMKSIF